MSPTDVLIDTLRPEPPHFAPEEMLRYGRHFQLPEMGTEGQAKLKKSRVLLVGVGGLGSPAALYLAAAGVGTLGVADPDRVELSNLQRQVLHGTPDIGRPKSESAEERIHDINPHVAVERFDTRLTSDNALEVMESFDVVIDGSDNFPTRYLVNDAAVMLGLPDVYGSVHRFEGQVSVFASEDGPC
jgi:molybdopterin/thiamine biosynthesis adenylyltransferase